MKYLKSLFLALALAFAGLFGGCASHTLQDEHVQITGDVPDWLRFEYINHVTRGDGLIEFEARFFNTKSSDRTLSYKVVWFNEDGFTEDTIMTRWVSAVVEGNRNLLIHGVAPSVKVKDFRIQIGDQNKGDLKRLDSYHNRYSN